MRALLIAEAELGERLMRALILRRTQMLQSGVGGPVIVGRADNADVLRLEVFLARNGTPRMMLDPDTDPEANALIDRFHVIRDSCRSSSARADRVCAIPATSTWRVTLDWSARSISTGYITSPSSARGRRALPLRSMRHRRDFFV